MVWLRDGEKKLKICLFISTEYANVTDRQTDRHILCFYCCLHGALNLTDKGTLSKFYAYT